MFSLHKLKFHKIEHNILEKNLNLTVSATSYIQPLDLQTILAKAREENKNVVFTHIAGPIHENAKVKLSTEKRIRLSGGELLMKALNQQCNDLNAIVYVINKEQNHAQAGLSGYLTQCDTPNLLMISDSNHQWEKAFNTPVMKVGKEHYFKPFSLVVTPEGAVRAFEVQRPITDEAINSHLLDMRQYLALLQEAKSVVVNKV